MNKMEFWLLIWFGFQMFSRIIAGMLIINENKFPVQKSLTKGDYKFMLFCRLFMLGCIIYLLVHHLQFT